MLKAPGTSYFQICDFGTSKFASSTVTMSSTAGTCAWMAPEVAREEKASQKSDVWSFGVVSHLTQLPH